MNYVLKAMIPVRYYTDSMQHASQVLTDTLAEWHSKAAEPFAEESCVIIWTIERINAGKRICKICIICGTGEFSES